MQKWQTPSSSSSWRRWMVVWMTVTLLAPSSAIAAATDSYNAYRYDCTVPQFTPDGRLLQTEYAAAAADRSSPIVCARIISTRTKSQQETEEDDEDDDEDVITLLACCSISSSSRSDSTPPTGSAAAAATAAFHPHPPLQSRLILLRPNSNYNTINSNNMDHDTDDNTDDTTLVLCLAGIRADCLAVVQQLQDAASADDRQFAGARWPPRTARSLAARVAATCHAQTVGGGIRPGGCTAWITDDANNWVATTTTATTTSAMTTTQKKATGLVLHQTDPSGSVRDILVTDPQPGNNNNNSNMSNRVVVLGGGAAGLRLQRRLHQEWTPMPPPPSPTTTTTTTTKTAASEATAAANFQRRAHIGKLLALMMDELSPPVPESSSNRHRRRAVAAALEVVLLSPRRGAIKLTPDQVQSFLRDGHQQPAQ